MELDHCPICGSDLECSDGLLRSYCVSPDCGALFHDVNTGGLLRHFEAQTRDEIEPMAPARRRR